MRVPDEADEAQAFQQRLNDSGMAAWQQARRLRAERSDGPPGICRRCGEDIPAARQAAVPGVRTCVECQGLAELRAQ